MKSNKLITMVVTALMFAVSVSASAKDLVLASGGHARYGITVSEKAGESERFAASELAKFLGKMTGAEFTVSTSAVRNSIYVGLSDNIPGGDLKKVEGESYGISHRDGDVYLYGGNDRSVIYSVYAFLESLGCRWVAPEYVFYEGRSSLIPSVRKLVCRTAGDVVVDKVFKYRKFYVEEGLSHNTSDLLTLIDWMPKNGYNTIVVPINYEGRGEVMWDNWREALTPELEKRGILIEVGGHGYQNFFNATLEDGRLFERHPEWFGVDKQGNRSKDPRMVFCTSEPEAFEYMVSSIMEYLRSHPEIDIFDFWPPDGAQWCNCERCRKIHPTDRHLALVSKMSDALKEELPGIILECIAYASYIAPPAHERLSPDVLLDFCPIGQNFEVQIYDESSKANANYKKQLDEWKAMFTGDISIYTYFRKYIWQSLPNICPHYMQKDILYYQEAGANGASIYSEPGDWFAYGPNHYLLSRLCENPSADVDALMRDYSEVVYKDKADVALKIYDLLERTVSHATRFPSSDMKPLDAYDPYLAEVREARSYLDKEIAGCADEVTRHHLERLGLMLRYVDMSIIERKNEVVAGKKLSGNIITDEVRALFSDNLDKGIFIIRK